MNSFDKSTPRRTQFDPGPTSQKAGMGTRTGRITFLLVLLLAVALTQLTGKVPATFPVPSPNGYDDFLMAAALVRGERPPAQPWTSEQYQNGMNFLLSLEAEAFSLVGAGLKKPCQVIIRTSPDYEDEHREESANLKHLVHCMTARAELARAEGRTKDACEGLVEGYSFTQEIGRGGLFPDRFNQLSCEVLVIRGFDSLVSALDSEQCAQVLGVIDQAERNQESLEAVAQRTRRWRRATFDSLTRTKEWLTRLGRTAWESWVQRSMIPVGDVFDSCLQVRQEENRLMLADLRGRLQQQLVRSTRSASPKRSQ
jgi:hypothetical protein